MMASGDCYNITRHDFHAAKTTRDVLNTFVCLVCIIAAAIIIFLKAYKKFIHRLLVILVVATFLHMIVDVLEFLAITYEGPHNDTGSIIVKDGKGALTWCVISGCLGHFLRLILLLLLCWIAVHLCLSLHGKNCCIKERWVHMIILAITLFLSAFPLIPLCPGKTMAYGLSGIGCGFRDLNVDCHYSSGCEVVIAVFFLYVPFLTGFVFLVGTVVYMLLKLCVNTHRLRPSTRVQYKRAMKSTGAAAIFLFIGTTLFFITQIIILFRQSPKKAINLSTERNWVWYTVPEPILLLLIPVSIIVQPGTLKRLRWSELKLAARKWIEKEEDHYETEYEVTGHLENSGEEYNLVIRGSSTNSRKSIPTYGINNEAL